MGAKAFGFLRTCGRRLATEYLRRLCPRCDLYHEPNIIPLPVDCPTVATVHDLSVLVHPEWHPADRVAYFERELKQGLERCVHFLAISEFGRQEMIRHLNIPPERITRTYMGIRSDLGPMPQEKVSAILNKLRLPPRYLLYVGTIEPRKNLLMLLRAYCAIPEALRKQCPLLLIGSWGWNSTKVAEYLHHHARHRQVLYRGYVEDQYLAAIYNGARALLYPSFYEGFGLPPVEMLACGGAVLSSTADAMVEVVGRQAQLIHPEDADGWHAAMTRVMTDNDWWFSLRNGAEAIAQPYTWKRCAAETMAVYRSICGLRPPPSRARQETSGAANTLDRPEKYQRLASSTTQPLCPSLPLAIQSP